MWAVRVCAVTDLMWHRVHQFISVDATWDVMVQGARCLLHSASSRLVKGTVCLAARSCTTLQYHAVMFEPRPVRPICATASRCSRVPTPAVCTPPVPLPPRGH